MALPPGFEFDPTDEELIINFLYPRATCSPCFLDIIPHLDIYETDPCDLHEKAFWSKKEWYFFSRWKQKRVTRKGFWKEVGLREPIFTSSGVEVGFKIYLVFCGDGVQSNWIMEEFHINPAASQPQQLKERLVLCRVGDSAEKMRNSDEGVELSYLDEVFFSIEDDDQDEITFPAYIYYTLISFFCWI